MGQALFWFRRDLRLNDNVGLYHALKGESAVIPIFIFDPDILDELEPQDARVTFIHERLDQLSKEIAANGGQLQVFYGKVEEIFRSIFREHAIQAIYSNKDYEPYARQRDAQIAAMAASGDIAFRQFKDQVVFEEDEIVKADGSPYVVYTPYRKKWEERFAVDKPVVLGQPNTQNWQKGLKPKQVSLKEMGFVTADISVPDFRLTSDLIDQYEDQRNFPAKDDATSRLGPHLRFGTVSVRELANFSNSQRNSVFLHQLIWRDFFMQILWHFPHTTERSFKPAYDRINWRNDPEEFERWTKGETGYPMVDAGMRQLVQTGYMHNRVRMVVASFLCKHLLIDWRWGEAFFAKHLLDFELAANVGNWQWAAGSGVDAAPYFRVFNPTTQFKKFDPDTTYVSTWVPHWQELNYPRPMVDHKMARERCLTTYKAALQ
ncbi:cryptochrome/photolyase family protein [Aureitalea marina]|uniref:Deoxyribodipyrimidine photolyase n=1 Tax=Aureitalea marina TaxID=930804 RepID=A0A2S7KPN7_9FLAO|nr:deoxyribodipyrimidine photo-lyase [Aureitalea marina]PQB04533.1 deoxyribodipyrimidine photolyase [Aureitalea marina]